jgi:valyl-tRNA synthetase
MNQLPDRYSPQDVERRIYKWWDEMGAFRAQDVSTLPPYSIILPPPNVTGSLHMGHALDHTLQDTLIRWKRMSGFNALWLPGTDHAGIATQTVVERELKKEGLRRHDLGREKFVERVWKWKQTYGNRIYEQMRMLGDSCDWSRSAFTLDEGVSKAVRHVFVTLYQKGLIYRGTRLINWSPALESAISDLEVEHREVKGQLYHIRYPAVDGKGEIIVATTRPETLLGDVAVAVHPEDERYKSLIGKKLNLPLLQRQIVVIGDTAVEKEFGTGAVKVTPAHDFNDYAMGARHSLPTINILNKDGSLNSEAGVYKGLKNPEARKRIVEDLEKQGFLVKTEAYVHSVGFCQRTGVAVEPMISDQWFVRMKELAVPARRVVESGTLRFEPASWTKTYLHWMSIIEDWCISRQLWWGHRIPAWNCQACHKVTVVEVEPKVCSHCGNSQIVQDEDVLDTWFSSALWPFSTMGWPAETEAQKTFYPTSVLVTGHDIIFFWVARMIMMGLEFKRDVPFRTVYIHGLIRDAQGKKMSKTLNNSIDPVDLIEKFGADSLRFTLMSQVGSGRDPKFSMQRLEGYRNFMNKIWNAARFSLTAFENFEVPAEGIKGFPARADLSAADQWIISKLGICEKLVDEALTQFRFSDAASAIYTFVWHEFCDWYLEFSKPVIYGTDEREKKATQLVLAQTLNRVVRLLHPFAPFITEEIYQKLPLKGKALITDTYPTIRNDKDWLALGSPQAALELDVVKEVISAIRNVRGENRIKPGEKITALLVPYDEDAQKIVSANKTSIMSLARLEKCEILADSKSAFSKCAVTPVRLESLSIDVVVPLEGLVDIDEEIKRLRKAIDKTQKDISGLNHRLEDPHFVSNAPADIVDETRAQLEQLKSEIASLETSLSRLR